MAARSGEIRFAGRATPEFACTRRTRCPRRRNRSGFAVAAPFAAKTVEAAARPCRLRCVPIPRRCRTGSPGCKAAARTGIRSRVCFCPRPEPSGRVAAPAGTSVTARSRSVGSGLSREPVPPGCDPQATLVSVESAQGFCFRGQGTEPVRLKRPSQSGVPPSLDPGRNRLRCEMLQTMRSARRRQARQPFGALPNSTPCPNYRALPTFTIGR